MTPAIGVTLAIVLVSIILFVTEKLRIDAVAVLVVSALAIAGLIDGGTALSGFSNQATITVAAMFVLAAGLQKSGALSRVGDLLGRARSPTEFLLLLFAVLGIIAPFVNNTAVVAVLMPVVISASAAVRMPASRALIPLSFVSQMAGVTTLIGTSTTLIVNAMAQDMGHPGFTMFEIAPLGVLCMGAGCLYLLLFGRWLLPDTRSDDRDGPHDARKYMTELRILPDSPLIGTSAGEARLGEDYTVFVLELLRKGRRIWMPRAEKLQEGDVLLARGDWSDFEDMVKKMGVEIDSRLKMRNGDEERGRSILTEVLVAPRSRLIGRSLFTLARGWRHDAVILAVHRRQQIIRRQIREVRFEVGDILLMYVAQDRMGGLRNDPNLIVLSEWRPRTSGGLRAVLSLAIMALVVGVAAVGWLPIAVTALMGALAMPLVGCLRADEVYDAIDWRIIVLMAGLLPLGAAMSSSGTAQFLVSHTVGLVRDLGPAMVLAVLYLVALLLAEMMSNSAAAVLLTPIGMSTAGILGVDATPFLVAVTFSASTSFLTPIGYQTNTMVYTAGNYRFVDFVKVGLPLNLIFWVMGVIFIPVIWPF